MLEGIVALKGERTEIPPPIPEPPPQPTIPKLEISLAVVVVLLGGFAWKYWLEPYLNRLQLSLQYTREQDTRIRDCLNLIRAYSQADRAFLCQFVCTGKTVAGRAAYNMMISHEVTAANSTKAMPFGSNTNFTCVDFIIQSLLATPFQKKSIDSINDAEYKAYLYNLGAYYVVYQLLEMNREPIGFVVLHYNNRASLMDWEAVTPKKIEAEVQQITYTLQRGSNLWHALWENFRKS